MIGLVAIDIDGTLLNDDMELSQENITALSRVQKRGIPVVLCSARGPRSCFPIVEQFGGKDPIVTHNGAVVIDPDHNIRHMRTLDKELLTKAINTCRRLDLHYDINDIYDVYVEHLADWMVQKYEDYYIDPIQVPDLLAVPNLRPAQVILCGDPEQMEDAFTDLQSLTGDSFAIQRTAEEFIAIRHVEATKREGTIALAQQWGIGPEQVVAIGNYYNDIPLLQWAGVGVAVANAPAEVQQAADVVVASNNDCGVAEALERLVL